MELHIKDRIFIPQMLPQQCKFMEVNMKREIINKVMLTEGDKEKYEIKDDKENSRITWNINTDMECPLVVDFSEQELKFMKESCEKLAEAPYPDDFWVTVEKIYDALQST